MSVMWKYLDKRSAAIAAIKDYDSMQFIISSTGEEVRNAYRELQAHPYIQLCVCDQETMTYVRLGGRVNFTTDQNVIDRCFEASPVLTSQFGNHRDVVIGYYLTEVWAEFSSFSNELPNKTWRLPNKYDAAQ